MFFLKYFPISIFIFFVVLSFEDEFLVVMAHPTHLSQPGLQMLLINGQQHDGHKEPHHIVKRSSCSASTNKECFDNCVAKDKDKKEAKKACAGLCECNLPSKN
ncbi:hypothetical protein ACQ4LE_004625 [Meloidogyne hapla]